ncbi:glucosaminidase domain-containing protein [Reinekea sp.]|jgi:uncharacterized FlgJ-related protein|uniref:glucosaminidase domain-containing protein n=1 Tax=Reinekea sp. TaxID=1970455 RepID=UPI003989E9E9
MKHWKPILLAILLLLPFSVWQLSKQELSVSTVPSGLTDAQLTWLDTLAELTYSQNKLLSSDWHKAHTMLGDTVKQKQNSTWILNKMHRYGLWENNAPPAITDTTLNELLKQMAPVPASIVLAQAIISSNWGQTPQARVANNLFNVVCYEPECGMVDDNLSAHSQWKLFNSKASSVRWFIERSLNQERFETFRNERFKMQLRGAQMNGHWYRDKLPKEISATIAEFHLTYWGQLIVDEM